MLRLRCHISLFCTAALLSVTAGCYTKFAAFEPVAVAPRADTVKATDADKETCIWERDLMGYPYLHCYPSYYPRQWYLYNYSPWWYHNDRYLFNADRCPPYYYYDPNCGCCRYYLNNPDLHHPLIGGDSKGSTETTSGSTLQPQDTNRVSISTSSHISVSVPLYGNPGTSNTSTGTASTTASQTAVDSLAAKQAGDSSSVNGQAADTGHTAGNAPAQQDTVKVLPVKKLRRSMRGR